VFACNFSQNIIDPSATISPTISSSVALTQLSKPIVTPTVGYISREAYDFLPSPTPTSLPTPTNVFAPVNSLNEYSDLFIILDRRFCFGSCPDYSLTISGNGKGVYEGRGGVKVIGFRYFTVTEAQLDELIKAFESVHYFSLDDYYSVPITDMETVTTSITFQGLSKEVKRYGFCMDYENIVLLPGEPKTAAPKQVCDLEDKIDKIVDIRQWTGR
jgi:hypothetical protein